MAANAYIQSAVSELNDALNDINTQIRSLESDTQRRKQALHHDVQVLERRQSILEVQRLQMKTHGERNVMTTLVEQTERKRDQKFNQIQQLESELKRQVQRKNQTYSQLQGFVSQLSTRFSSSVFC